MNLIPFNPIGSISHFKSSSDVEVSNFQKVLRGTYNIRTTVRKQMGQDISGACGQLVVNLPNKRSSVNALLLTDIEDLHLWVCQICLRWEKMWDSFLFSAHPISLNLSQVKSDYSNHNLVWFFLRETKYALLVTWLSYSGSVGDCIFLDNELRNFSDSRSAGQLTIQD